ncbi:MAG: hypothetical protein KIT18_12830 [Burkholderiales bacterium]|nr:hypothetical protein [Burkholderiales bacterium]
MRVISAFGFVVLCSAAVQAQERLEERRGYIECGNARIAARAMCYEATSYCVTQTFTFSSTGSRATLAPHPHKSGHEVAGKAVEALDYHAGSWSCVGRYLLVGLHRSGEASCGKCEYEQVYNLSGRLLASALTVDDRGRVRENPQGRLLVETLAKGLERGQIQPIYRRHGGIP